VELSLVELSLVELSLVQLPLGQLPLVKFQQLTTRFGLRQSYLDQFFFGIVCFATFLHYNVSWYALCHCIFCIQYWPGHGNF
jgi:hypothetical protein